MPTVPKQDQMLIVAIKKRFYQKYYSSATSSDVVMIATRTQRSPSKVRWHEFLYGSLHESDTTDCDPLGFSDPRHESPLKRLSHVCSCLEDFRDSIYYVKRRPTLTGACDECRRLKPPRRKHYELRRSKSPIRGGDQLNIYSSSAEHSWTHASSYFRNSFNIQVSPPRIVEEEEEPGLFASGHPTASWGNMLSLAEAARLIADSHIIRDDHENDSLNAKQAKSSLYRFSKNASHICLALIQMTTLGKICYMILQAGGPTNSTQLKVQGQAENIALNRLYTLVARNGIVQIMTILVSWGEILWRPAGHAVRMAMDLCPYRCLPYLIEKGIRSGKYPVVLVDERPVVMGTGIWFTVRCLRYYVH
ncbi:hypothetical protein L204_100498 [Cryptococcus depauperatus]